MQSIRCCRDTSDSSARAATGTAAYSRRKIIINRWTKTNVQAMYVSFHCNTFLSIFLHATQTERSLHKHPRTHTTIMLKKEVLVGLTSPTYHNTSKQRNNNNNNNYNFKINK